MPNLENLLIQQFHALTKLVEFIVLVDFGIICKMQIPLDDHILLLAQCNVDAAVICILPVHPFPGKPVIT